MFTPIRDGNEKLSEKIVEQVRNSLMMGELKPGDKLPSENEFCELFGVSRTSVREAIKMLTAMGIVEVYRGKGIFVRTFSPETMMQHIYPIVPTSSKDFEDIIAVRRVLECEAARLAALHITENDLAELERIVRAALDVDLGAEDATERLHASNSQFHRCVAKGSGSHVLLYIIQPLWDIIEQARRISLTFPERKRDSVVEHADILSCIRRGDAEGAYATMDAHLKGISSAVRDKL